MGKFMLALLVLILVAGYSAGQTGDPLTIIAVALLVKLFFICIPIAIIVWIFKAAVRTTRREWDR